MSTTEYLDQLDATRAAATPGPWQVVVSGGTDLFTGESYREIEIDFNDPVEKAGLILGEHEIADADAALIVAAVNALPKLTAALRAALAECEALEDDRSIGIEGDYTDSAFRIRKVVADALGGAA